MNIVYILKTYYFCCCSVTKSCPTLCNLMPGFPVLQCLLVFSNSSPLSQRCHSTISSFDVPFSSCPQSFSALGFFQMSQPFASCGQSIGISASASALPMNIQDWSPLGWTGWISLQSKGLSRVFSSTTIWKTLFLGFLYFANQMDISLHIIASFSMFLDHQEINVYWLQMFLLQSAC